MKKISLTLYGLAVVALIGAIAMRSEAQQDSIANDEKATINESPSATSLPESVTDPFEQAVSIIKKYEGMHHPRHWPLVGYGHKVLPGEKYSRSATLSEKQADALLRKDLLKNCAVFREYGADSLLLGTLAYNNGDVMRIDAARNAMPDSKDALRLLVFRKGTDLHGDPSDIFSGTLSMEGSDVSPIYEFADKSGRKWTYIPYPDDGSEPAVYEELKNESERTVSVRHVYWMDIIGKK